MQTLLDEAPLQLTLVLTVSGMFRRRLGRQVVMARVDDLELPTTLMDIVDGRRTHGAVRLLGCLVLGVRAGIGPGYVLAGLIALDLVPDILVLSLRVETVALALGMGLDIAV